jgi:hypothetical protein
MRYDLEHIDSFPDGRDLWMSWFARVSESESTSGEEASRAATTLVFLPEIRHPSAGGQADRLRRVVRPSLPDGILREFEGP